MTASTPRVGLVLGAGGTPGGAFIRAALVAIETRTGWPPASAKTIIGTSVGALNAARQPLPETAVAATGEHIAALSSLAAMLDTPSPDPLTPLVARLRLVGGRLVAALAPAGSHGQDYDVAVSPYHPGVVTVSVVRRSGRRRAVNLATAASPKIELYASAAVPGFVKPVDINGEQRIDGAVWSTTNADLVSVDAHDALVVIAPMVPRHGGSVIARTHRAQLLAELDPWRQSGKPVVVVTPTGVDQRHRADQARFAAVATELIRTA